MGQVVPWTGLLALIEPFYPKAGNGRPPYPLETLLCIHLLQNWFALSDPAMEEALYEITSLHQFTQGSDQLHHFLGHDPYPIVANGHHDAVV